MFEPQRWAESTANEISFPDDDAEAMLIVLRIAHLRFQELPGIHGLPFETLFNLAVTCDKYDTIKLVRPFLESRGWTRPHNTNVLESWDPSWLFVALKFGYISSFEHGAKYLIRNISLSSNGIARLSNGKTVFRDELPLGCLGMFSSFTWCLIWSEIPARYPSLCMGKRCMHDDRIILSHWSFRCSCCFKSAYFTSERLLKAREYTLSALTQTAYEVLDQVLTNKVCLKDSRSYSDYWKMPHSSHSKCRCMILGSYVDFLIGIGLYPTQKAGPDLSVSVKAMAEKFKTFEVHYLEDHFASGSHKECSDRESRSKSGPYHLCHAISRHRVSKTKNGSTSQK